MQKSDLAIIIMIVEKEFLQLCEKWKYQESIPKFCSKINYKQTNY